MLREKDGSWNSSETFAVLCNALGVPFEDSCRMAVHSGRDLYGLLADFIEPEPYCIANVTIDGEELERVANNAVKEAIGIDRDALLKLAYFMDRVAVEFMDTAPHEFNPCTLAKAWAREIREALGVDE